MFNWPLFLTSLGMNLHLTVHICVLQWCIQAFCKSMMTTSPGELLFCQYISNTFNSKKHCSQIFSNEFIPSSLNPLSKWLYDVSI